MSPRAAGAFRGGKAVLRDAGGVVAAAIGAPTITSITPSSGAAGTAVVVLGANFIAGATCTVGGVSITPSVTNSTRIDGTTGAHADGAVDVVVTTTNGSATSTNGYTYSSAVAALFHVDWSTATGTGDSALRDTGKNVPFDSVPIGGTSSAGVLAVISSSGLGFPATMTNVLRVRRNADDNYGFCKITSAQWAAQGIGETRFYRIYLHNAIPNVEGTGYQGGDHSIANFHPIQFPHDATSGFAPIRHGTLADGTYPVDAFQSANTFPYDHWSLGTFSSTYQMGGGVLPKFVAQRYEWAMTRTASTTYTVAMRIYDSAGVLLWSDDGVGASGGAIKNVITSGQVNLSTRTFTQTDFDRFLTFGIGTNGGPHNYSQDVYYYYGGFCIRTDTWCGAYSGGI